ncbi:MAG: hypothetical protein KA735_01925 [Burkholderiaceae bacterium]|nr:hypothetical protein [Burkholderiaceae bacterium]
MPIYLGRYLAGLSLMLCGWTATASPAAWEAPPSRLDLATPHGELHVTPSDYVYESVLRLNNTDIEPRVVGLLNIPYAYNMPEFHAALVSIHKGNEGCPVVYRWVRIDKSGYSVTPEFGSCSENIQVSAKGRTLTVVTPSSTNPDKMDSYTYDGNAVKRRQTP